MYPYVSVNELREIDIASDSPRQDSVLTKLIQDASRDFELMCRDRVFYPYRETKRMDLHQPKVNTTLFTPNNIGYNQTFSAKSFYWRMSLPDDLNKVVSVKVNGVELYSTEYILRAGTSYSPPFSEIDIDPKVSLRINTGGEYPIQFPEIEVDGYWGYVESWEKHLIDTFARVSEIDGSTITIEDSQGVNAHGLSPAIEPMKMYIASQNVTDVETLETKTIYEFIYIVQELNKAEGKFRVLREAFGSDKVELKDKYLYEFIPVRGVRKAVRRLSAWYYRQKNSSSPDIDRPILTNAGVIMPAQTPADVKLTVDSYIRMDGISEDTVNRQQMWSFE